MNVSTRTTGRQTVFALFLGALSLVTVFALPAAGIRQPVINIAPDYNSVLLPQDPAVRVGRLANGVTFYVRENREPVNRAFLRLVVNAGSLQEDEDQLGLAHFVEHMAFRGTTDFDGSQIVEYLESLGMRFGPDVNAYTSFDETVYMLQVPTDRPELVERGFHVLEQWAHQVTFAEDAVDRERGVIFEEWRVGRGAQARMRDQQFPVLFANSRYAERLPIGDMDVVMNAPAETLRRFFRDWYRPELMAVIAVGDFDGAEIEGLIRRFFGPIPVRTGGRERRFYDIPEHSGTRFTIASDPEAARTTVTVYVKEPARPLNSVGDYRRLLAHSLFGSMLSTRFQEMAEDPDAPFLSAGAGFGTLVRPTAAHFLSATVDEDSILDGFAALLREVERVERFGFTDVELERARARLLRSYESAFEERDRTSSNSFMGEYTRHFLREEAFPGIAFEFELAQKLIPDISLDEINALAAGYAADHNRVVAVSSVERDGHAPADEAAMRAVMAAIAAEELEPYEPDVTDIPLISELPPPGRVVEERLHDDVDVIEWLLSNGARVLVKQTDFRADEILFDGFSFGGHSTVSDEDHPSALMAPSIVQESGVGSFSPSQLTALLAGQRVSVSPYIRELTQGFSGSASPRDLETLLQLVFLYAREPRRDEAAFRTFMRRSETNAANRERQPDAVFSDRLRGLYFGGHPRFRPVDRSFLQEVDLDRALAAYQRLFSDFGDATFVFVGNVDPDALQPLVEQYLATLPSRGGGHAAFADIGVQRPTQTIRDQVRSGIEQQSSVAFLFHGEHPWSRVDNHLLRSLGELLRLRLREVLREDEGGTYGVGAAASPIRFPRSEYIVEVFFGTDPERAQELASRVLEVIAELQNEPVGDGILTRVQTTQLRSFETNLRSNSFWLTNLRESVIHDLSPGFVLDYPQLVDQVTADALQRAARRYLNMDRFIELILLPAE